MIINGAPIILITVTDEQVTLERPSWGPAGDGGGGKLPQHWGHQAGSWDSGGACEPYWGDTYLALAPACLLTEDPSLFTYTSTHWLILIHAPCSLCLEHSSSSTLGCPCPPLRSRLEYHLLGGPSRTILFPVEPSPTNTLSTLLSFPDVGNAEMNSDWGSASPAHNLPNVYLGSKAQPPAPNTTDGDKIAWNSPPGVGQRTSSAQSYPGWSFGARRVWGPAQALPNDPNRGPEMTLFHRALKEAQRGAMLQPGVHRLQLVSLWGWWCMNLSRGAPSWGAGILFKDWERPGVWRLRGMGQRGGGPAVSCSAHISIFLSAPHSSLCN